MAVLFTASTPWVLYCAHALRLSTYAHQRCHLLIILKGDAPVFQRAVGQLVCGELWDSVHLFNGRNLSRRFSEIVLSARDRSIPLRARRLIAGEIDELEGILREVNPRVVVLGNKWHAPEGCLYLGARRRGYEVGFMEEGLSVYLRKAYWEAGFLRRFRRRLAYHYHGVSDLYWADSRHFDFAYLSMPERYGLFDTERRLSLFSAPDGFLEASRWILREDRARREVEGLTDGAPLILSQRLSEDGLVSRAEEEEVWTEIIKDLLERYPRVYFKRHPRDLAGKFEALRSRFGAERLSCLGLEEYPVEAALFFWKPAEILGFLSGTLVYARKMFGLKTRSAVNLLRADTPGLRTFRQVLDLCPEIEGIGGRPAALLSAERRIGQAR